VTRQTIAAASLAVLCLAASASGQTTPVAAAPATPAAAPQPNNYTDGKSWLCRPDLPADQNACSVDNTTTVVSAAGTLTR